ncbi:hypothetical protein [Polaromonas sp.]|uniref:hypothetical protein n=1 Tax=Polaromonas sp. TaxID=1869339 RepID=UPI0027339E2A|nr:hypothetical protein [Polaromonas sp.]
MTGFFASRQCPGTAIRAAMDWAVAQARGKLPVIGGFHSPLEQSVLEVLLAAHSPAVVVLARDVAGATFPVDWREPIEAGRMAVVSAWQGASRLTAELAAERNTLAARLAQCSVVAHAAEGGSLAGQIEAWTAEGLSIQRLPS